MAMFKQHAVGMVVRSGRRSSDPVVMTSRIPSWVFGALALLVVMDVALAGILIRAKASDAKEVTPAYASIDSLEGRLEKSPNDPRILQQLAFEYRKSGMLDDALRVNRQIADMDPNNTSSRFHIGSILSSMGDNKRAEIAYWDVLEIDPTHATAAQALGEIYLGRRQYKSLLVAIEPAAVDHPEIADLQYLWGIGKEKTGDVAGARRAYWLAMERDPSLAEARTAYDRLHIE